MTITYQFAGGLINVKTSYRLVSPGDVTVLGLTLRQGSIIRAVFISFKTMRVAVCAVALVFVAWRFILPLALMYIGGLGVFSPIPKRLATAHPKLAVYLFVLGGPMLFLALLVTLIWLLRS